MLGANAIVDGANPEAIVVPAGAQVHAVRVTGTDCITVTGKTLAVASR